MPTRLLESVIETTDLPHPATRLTISSCFGWGDEAEYWALLIVGTFYDATGRAFWSNEIFLGQLLWRDGHDGNLRGDTESESSSDSSSEATNIVVDATASSQEDTESEGTDEEDDSESLSGESCSHAQRTVLPILGAVIVSPLSLHCRLAPMQHLP